MEGQRKYPTGMTFVRTRAPTAGRVRRWLAAQAEEIVGDPVLRLYGVALGLAYVVTYLAWTTPPGIAGMLASGSPAICWPFWEDCSVARVFDAAGITTILRIWLAAVILAGAAFAFRRTSALGVVGLALVEIVRVLIVAQDFRLRLNQHTMLTWAAAAFLLLPSKRRLIPALLVSFYFWAGVLKLDGEWLSGAALYNLDRFWIPAPLLPAACAYVVLLELVLVWGLYSRRGWVFWGTLAQLAVFHVFSWPVVGFYYPLLMFALLSIFPAGRLLGGPEGEPGTARVPASGPAAVFLAAFALSQVVAYAFPGDSAITGEGRLFALNMFDAKVVCEGTMRLHMGEDRILEVPIRNEGYAHRIRCDPVLYFNLARNACREFRSSGWITDLDLRLRSRRSTEPGLRDVIVLDRFCETDPTFDMWRPNPWILH